MIPAARNILDTPFYLVLYRQAMQPSGKDAGRWITDAFRDHLNNGTPEKTTLMLQMLLREINNLRSDITSAERELRGFILTKVLPYLGYQMALSSRLDPALTPIKSPNFFRRDAYARTYACLSAYLPTIDIWNEYKNQNPETLEKPWNTLRKLYQDSNPDISDLTAAIPYTVFPSGLLCHHGRNISFCHDNYRDFFAAFHIANVVYGLCNGINLAALSPDAQEVFLLQLETLDKWIATGLPVKGNKRKAEAMLVAERQKYQPAEYQRTADANMLFADYMLYWLRQIKSSVDITTYAGYKTNVEKRIVPFFRGRKVTLGGLRAGDIQDFYTYCATELEISNNTIIKYHANISKALNDAVRLEKIPMTPLKRGMRPKQVEHIGKFYTLTEAEQLLRCVQGDGVEFPVLMAAFYGLRREEIMGLRWQSIDFDANTITIAHTVVQVNIDGKSTVVAKDRAKNKKSYRTLPLVPEYRNLLLKMKKHQEEYRELCGNCYHESDYIYVNDIGEQIKPNYVTQHFKLILRKNNLREITFHELRHTCASLLLKSGVSMKDIQAWLGHSNYNTTANIYAHLESNSKELTGNAMQGNLTISGNLAAMQE